MDQVKSFERVHDDTVDSPEPDYAKMYLEIGLEAE